MKAAIWRWERWQVVFTSLILVLAAGIVLSGCGGGSSGSSSTTSDSTLPAPTVQSYAGDTYNVLDWEALKGASGYNVYVTIDGSNPEPVADNLLAEDVLPPFVHGDWMKDGLWVTGEGALEGGFTYRYVVTANFGATEGPCSNCVTCILELPGGGIWRIEGLGNNLSTPLLFSEGRGLYGLTVTDAVTELPLFDHTGLRTPTVAKVDGETIYTDPLLIEDPLVAGEITTLPLFYVDDLIPAFDIASGTFTGEEAYAQGTESIWQADWLDGVEDPQVIDAKWGDNLTGHQWPVTQDVLRVEVNLTQDVTPDSMTGYDMISLFGGKYAEFMGATGTRSEVTTRVVYSPHARLQIDKMDHQDPDPPADWASVSSTNLLDNAVWENYFSEDSDSTFRFGSEVNGAGSLTYGYVWMVKSDPQITHGWYRLTLRFDALADCTTTEPPAGIPVAQHETGDEELYPDPDIPVNTFLQPLPGPPSTQAEPGEGPLFVPILVQDPERAEGVTMSVLYIYLAQEE